MQARLEQHPLLTSPLSPEDSFRASDLRKPSKTYSAFKYSISTLKDLFAEQNKAHEEPDLRFTVNLGGALWLARESHARAPLGLPHKDLIDGDNCKTAGNLFFDDKRETLLKINHKSGDYRPSFSSLKWLLAILILNKDSLPFKLPEILELEELNDSGGPIRDEDGALIPNKKIALKDIRTWVDSQDPILISTLTAQPKESKLVHISRPEHPFADLDLDRSSVRALFGPLPLSLFGAPDTKSDDEPDIIEPDFTKGRKKPK